VHVAQQRRGSPVGDPLEAEAEAHQLAPRVLRGAAPAPALGAPAHQVLADTPHDEVVVAQAKRRLKLLETSEQEWYERQVRQLAAGRDVEEGLARRTRMAKQGLDPKAKEREEIEEKQVQRANRLPLEIKVTEDAVRFHVRFQARFEDLPARGVSPSSRQASAPVSISSGTRSSG